MDNFSFIFSTGNEFLSFYVLTILPLIIGILVLVIIVMKKVNEKISCPKCGEKYGAYVNHCGKCGYNRFHQ